MKAKSQVLTFALLAFTLLTPRAHAALTPTDRQAILAYSNLKTFGQFTRALVASKLATKEEAAGIESTLKANGLSLETEIAPGTFTDTRWIWEDVKLTRLNNGDWKTTGGRILSGKPETKIDQLFSQAMTSLNPRNAQRTPLDLLIDSADADTSARSRASAAGGWTIYEKIRRASSETAAWWNNSSQGNIDCTTSGGYQINNGYKASGTNWTSEKIPPTPLGQGILKAMCADVKIPHCSDQYATAMQAVLQQICGRNLASESALGGCKAISDQAVAAKVKAQPNWIPEMKRAAGESVFCTPTHKTAAEDQAYQERVDASSETRSARKAPAAR